jgi:hypothetical protein
VIGPVKRLLARWRLRRRQARELHPERLRRMVDELSELTLIAENAVHMDEVRRDMENLAKQLDDPQFRHLPVERRREFKNGLERSREAVLEALQSSSPPTTYLQ